jgi:hypothetical protein
MGWVSFGPDGRRPVQRGALGKSLRAAGSAKAPTMIPRQDDPEPHPPDEEDNGPGRHGESPGRHYGAVRG